MNEWQPIETAPKDGTPILGAAWCKYDKVWEMTTVNWYKFSTEWSLVVCGSYAEDSEWHPTHWMPLPKPPEEV